MTMIPHDEETWTECGRDDCEPDASDGTTCVACGWEISVSGLDGEDPAGIDLTAADLHDTEEESTWS